MNHIIQYLTNAINNVFVLTPFTGFIFAILVMLIICAVILGFASAFAGITTLMERKIAGRIQSRYGPNRVGPWGYLQFVADGIKLFLKEDIIPAKAASVPFKIAPYLIFAVSFAVFAVLPYGQKLYVADLNVGILYVVSISSVVVISILMAGWSSGNKWALFGAMRSVAQIISYEIPVALTIITVVMIVGSMSMQDIVSAQAGYAHRWMIFRYPIFTIPAFLIYFISSIAEVNRTPFDIPEAESELVAGYHTEYSGMRFSMFFMAEYANTFAVSAIAVTLFLGGWNPPYGSFILPNELAQLEGVLWFVAKAVALVFIMIWVRWTLPRYRVDQLMSLCWKVFLPISFVNMLGVAIWIVATA